MSAPPPGWVAHLEQALPEVARRLAPLQHGAPAPGRRAAVLLCFSPTAGHEGAGMPAEVLLLERAPTLRTHAGQPAFPGGAVDPGDDGPVAAALREAREETGLDPAGVRVLGTLPPLAVPVSGFCVTPVVAWEAEPSPVGVVDGAEVVAVVRVPLAELVDPANRVLVVRPRPGGDGDVLGPGFEAGGMLVWGFTAALLAAVLAATGLEQPWPAARTVPAPLAPPVARAREVQA